MPNKLEQAQEALAKVEAHMETLTPQTQAPHGGTRPGQSGRVHRHGPVQPQSGEILMPNVLTAAHEYLSGLGKN